MTTKMSRSLAGVTAALIVGGMAPLFDSTIVTLGLHTLQTELDVPVATVQWVATGYLLALAVAIPLVAWGQARLGAKRLWITALVVFGVGSVLCSLAWSAPVLIAFRVLQGLGGGVMMPMMQSVLIQAAGPEHLGRLMSAIALPVALGPILGPVIGGVILHWLTWPWMFWVNVPFCVVGLALAVRFLPGGRPDAPAPRFDLPGFLLLSPAFAALLFSLSNTHADGGFARTDVRLPGVAGLVALVGFVTYARRRGGDALVDVRLLRMPAFARVAGLMVFIGVGLFGVMFLLPLYWQSVRGTSVLAAGLYLIPQGVGSLASRMVAIRLVDRYGARTVAFVGFVVMALATVPFALAGGATGSVWLMVVLLVRGLGLGLVLIPAMSVAYVGIRKADVPHASIITRIAQQLGGAFGTAVLAVVLQSAQHRGDVAAAFRTAFWWGVGLTVVAVVLSAFLPAARFADIGTADERSATS